MAQNHLMPLFSVRRDQINILINSSSNILFLIRVNKLCKTNSIQVIILHLSWQVLRWKSALTQGESATQLRAQCLQPPSPTNMESVIMISGIHSPGMLQTIALYSFACIQNRFYAGLNLRKACGRIWDCSRLESATIIP